MVLILTKSVMVVLGVQGDERIHDIYSGYYIFHNIRILFRRTVDEVEGIRMTAFMKSSEMANHIGVSIDWLKKNKRKLFNEGVHYHNPAGKHTFWDVEKMVKWVREGNKKHTRRDTLIETVLS